jgi:hypothetical protein
MSNTDDKASKVQVEIGIKLDMEGMRKEILKTDSKDQLYWSRSVIPAHGRLRQEDHEFETSLG